MRLSQLFCIALRVSSPNCEGYCDDNVTERRIDRARASIDSMSRLSLAMSSNSSQSTKYGSGSVSRSYDRCWMALQRVSHHAECDHLLDVRVLDGRTDDDDPVVVDDITEVDGTLAVGK